MAATPSTPTPYRFIREEYYRMGEAGLFADERVELLDGEIISMPSQSPLYASSITRIISLMLREFDSVLSVRACAPIVLNNWSELEPDVAICRFDSDDYRHEHPKA